MPDITAFRAFRVSRSGDTFVRQVEQIAFATLPEHDLTVRVAYSSLNYKDALSATGNPGVSKTYPHTPGIDAAGTVVESRDPRFAPGDEVIVTSYDLGMNTPGGLGEYVRVPADWALPLPRGLSLRDAMVLGTAGLTAGLGTEALLTHGLEPARGPVVVTGASGGVGSVAVALLSKLGFEVWASTGTEAAHGWLRELGAAEILPREALAEPSERPLLEARFAGGIDTVGGEPLATLIKSLQYGASVAACGLVAGPQLSLTVFPFILRGVNLLGIDSAACPMAKRREVWEKLAGPWRVELSPVTREVTLDELSPVIDEILLGRTQGRVLVRVH